MPETYQELKYIESTGTQYIDAGISMSSINKISGRFAFTTTSVLQGLFGRWTQNNSTIQLIINPSNNILTFKWLDSSQTISMDTNQHTFELSNEDIIIDDIVKASYSKINASDTSSLVLFARRNDNSGTNIKDYAFARLYNLKIYSSSNLVRNFIPCYRKSDGVIGLYDLVNDVFYTNAGTGTFLKGPSV